MFYDTKNKMELGILKEVEQMEADKLKKLLDVAQQFQADQFWNQIFDENKATPSGKSLSLNPLTTIKEFVPKCDLYETDDQLIIEAEVPGLKREDLQISIHQQMMTISGEFKSLRPNCKYYLKERMNRKFKKELMLPYPVFVNQIRSEIKKGILTIVMPLYREEVEDIPITFEQSSSE